VYTDAEEKDEDAIDLKVSSICFALMPYHAFSQLIYTLLCENTWNIQDQSSLSNQGLTGHRKQKVDSLWAELNAEPSSGSSAGLQQSAKSSLKKGSSKSKKAAKKANKVLAGIFGKTTAASIVSKIKVKQKPTAAAAAAGGGSSTAAAVAVASTLKAPIKKQLVETKKFAGKEIT
jgi:hypothetical protein